MQAVQGTINRQVHRTMLAVVLFAATLLAAVALGYGIRAWTSSTSVEATSAPSIQQVSGPSQGRALPDRGDVAGSGGGQSVNEDEGGVLRNGHPR